MYQYRLKGGHDLPLCRYQGAALWTRGRQREARGTYTVVLGGAAMFGDGVVSAVPDLLEVATGVPHLNLALPGIGPMVWARDPGLLAVIRGASALLCHLDGQAYLSTPYYRVHPRRPDRLIAITPALQARVGGLDLHDLCFVDDLWSRLWSACPDLAQDLWHEVSELWLAQMQTLAQGRAVFLDWGPKLASKSDEVMRVRCAVAPSVGARWWLDPAAHEAAAEAVLNHMEGAWT